MNLNSQNPKPIAQNPTALKICGMKHPQNILEVAGLLPDYMGFIFYEKSARFFNGEIPKLPKSIKKTGVFVNASLSEIKEKIKTHDLQAVQLHGEETPELCHALQQENVEVIKVFSIQDDFDFGLLQDFENKVNYFFDLY